MPGFSRSIQRELEDQTLAASAALTALTTAAQSATTLAERLAVCRLLGALAGRAFDASWEVAEQAAFVLLDIARQADTPAERAGLLEAMGRGFRNLWLLPYVHRRLSDEDETVAAAALCAAGGLGFPALEEAMTQGFLGAEVTPTLRLAAIGALGRMGAESAASRLVPFVTGSPAFAAAALDALTEMRSRAGEAAALEVLSRDPPKDVLLAATRYLAEIGNPGVLPTLRSLARHEEAELRIAAGLASRAYKAERSSPADERILTALTERDRAVRAALARRLRTLPTEEVLAQAELLLGDDPQGVIQVVSEVRGPEVTRLLLRIADDESLDLATRARAVGAVEADEVWEREALVSLVRAPREVPVRIAAAQTIGAFAPLSFVLDHLASQFDEAVPLLRAALLWALQLATRPAAMTSSERSRVEALVRRALTDEDASVRKRAAYVAGNLDLTAVVPDLVTLARRETERADLRVAAFVALAEIGVPLRGADLAHLFTREDDPRALGAASRAIERAMEGGVAPASAATVPRVQERLRKLAASEDPEVRSAAVRMAGLAKTALSPDEIVPMLSDPAPRVREQVVVALGRMGGERAISALVGALEDADPSIQERAAHALLAWDERGATLAVLDFLSRCADRAAALRVISRLQVPRGDVDAFLETIAKAIASVGPDDPIYEPLLARKVGALESMRSVPPAGPSVDAAITALFPTWPRLSATRGFSVLAKSLRTAELLYGSIARGGDADFAGAIVLWMKSLEGYLHAWLSPRLGSLESQPRVMMDVAERMVSTSWPTYQRFLEIRWRDPVTVGTLSVEVPLRSAVNVLRDVQDRRRRPLDSPASVTEWSRLMLFFAVEHPSGARNLLKVSCAEAERLVRLAHRLQVLAQVRNAVTHRLVAEAATLEAFRRSYYASFEELTAMA